ncbi:MAG TPA: hypothetical protein DCX07_14185 [Phycisphaerales bacterium]|nr:hypothetical protein [Phycisphaerales bacterium]
MTELYPTDTELNALSGTSDSGQEVLFPTTGESPYYTSFYKMLYRFLDAARRAGDLRVYKDGDLTFGVRAGKLANGDNTIAYAGATAQALTNNQTNYIYLAVAAGVATLTVNTTGFPNPSATPHIPLATIVTSAGTYLHTAITDYRGQALYRTLNALTAALANEAATFFGATDLSGAEAETLSDGSDADTLHTHHLLSMTVEQSTAGVGAPNVLTAAETGKALTNEGSTATNYHTLPAAAAGLQFAFIRSDASDQIRITAAAGDVIVINAAATKAAGYVESTAQWDVLHLVAVDDVSWVAVSVSGTWTVETS